MGGQWYIIITKYIAYGGGGDSGGWGGENYDEIKTINP
jgi:hypothetical protein